MALLGEDGRGYELAKKLETCGVWRSWLGDSNYLSFLPSLGSPSAWETFMMSCDSKSRAQIQLQLRVRALLFDKASVSLFLRPSSSSATPSNLNPSYLQLQGDDVYFSLETDWQERAPHQEGAPIGLIQPKTQARLTEHTFEKASSVGSRYKEPVENISRRPGPDVFPETWYDQWVEKHITSRQKRYPFGERESYKRTPEGMSMYLKLLEKHKKRQKLFKEDHNMGFVNSISENGPRVQPDIISDNSGLTEEEACFLPEMMFPSNCVPDGALPFINRVEENITVEFCGVLDNLPHGITRSPAMIERFGVRPEYLRMGMERSKYRGKNGLEENRKPLSQEQVSIMVQKETARMLANAGFEGATEVSMEVLSEFLSTHISKLGRVLKLLTDSYRKQCSAAELLKMFLQTVGYSNFGALAEQLKDGAKVFPQQTQQQPARSLQPQHQSLLLQGQQISRQIPPQMHQLHPQNLSLQQQQWDKLRRRHVSTPRGSGMAPERERPMVEVKIENMSDPSIDGTYTPTTFMNKSQMQFRPPQQQQQQQQQQVAMVNNHHQFKQLPSLQIPQLQSQSTFGAIGARTPPVKVEGFQELMGGGDVTLKHELDDGREHRLTSPSK